MVELARDDSNRFCDPDFLKLFKVLVINDAPSFSLFDAEEAKRTRTECLQKITTLSKQWEKNQIQKMERERDMSDRERTMYEQEQKEIEFENLG